MEQTNKFLNILPQDCSQEVKDLIDELGLVAVI